MRKRSKHKLKYRPPSCFTLSGRHETENKAIIYTAHACCVVGVQISFLESFPYCASLTKWVTLEFTLQAQFWLIFKAMEMSGSKTSASRLSHVFIRKFAKFNQKSNTLNQIFHQIFPSTVFRFLTADQRKQGLWVRGHYRYAHACDCAQFLCRSKDQA